MISHKLGAGDELSFLLRVHPVSGISVHREARSFRLSGFLALYHVDLASCEEFANFMLVVSCSITSGAFKFMFGYSFLMHVDNF